jgi:hypothetical protein
VAVTSLLELEDVIGYLDLEADRDNHRSVLRQQIQAYREAYCARA